MKHNPIKNYKIRLKLAYTQMQITSFDFHITCINAQKDVGTVQIRNESATEHDAVVVICTFAVLACLLSVYSAFLVS